jgi:hypothetical protein
MQTDLMRTTKFALHGFYLLSELHAQDSLPAILKH